ncbi:complement C1q-like protein 4 [Mytilus californianus]|uniref:complement C1q-like protein 4 n=1 Tax=Mytilus californianus TaxID=6549 RepID=UPI0022466B21|nr:complement C1q-like protein 4 [Mytilus californianus]
MNSMQYIFTIFLICAAASFSTTNGKTICVEEDVIHALLTMNRSRVDEPSDPVFFAFLANDVTSNGYEVLKFANVKINKGSSYNPSTGYFTAPKPGIYQISCTIVGYDTNIFTYQIMLNGNSYTLGNTSSGGSWNSQTSTVLMNLKKGDQVYVQHRGSTQKVHANTNTYFSGYLVQ